jgi:hypothetical protein
MDREILINQPISQKKYSQRFHDLTGQSINLIILKEDPIGTSAARRKHVEGVVIGGTPTDKLYPQNISLTKHDFEPQLGIIAVQGALGQLGQNLLQ